MQIKDRSGPAAFGDLQTGKITQNAICQALTGIRESDESSLI